MKDERPRCRLCGKPSEGEHLLDGFLLGEQGETTPIQRPLCNACYTNVVEPRLCAKCKQNPATEPHQCPYAAEIAGNEDPEYCTCCSDCTRECAMDV